MCVAPHPKFYTDTSHTLAFARHVQQQIPNASSASTKAVTSSANCQKICAGAPDRAQSDSMRHLQNSQITASTTAAVPLFVLNSTHVSRAQSTQHSSVVQGTNVASIHVHAAQAHGKTVCRSSTLSNKQRIQSEGTASGLPLPHAQADGIFELHSADLRSNGVLSSTLESRPRACELNLSGQHDDAQFSRVAIRLQEGHQNQQRHTTAGQKQAGTCSSVLSVLDAMRDTSVLLQSQDQIGQQQQSRTASQLVGESGSNSCKRFSTSDGNSGMSRRL